MMLKKKIGSLLAVSAISLGVFASGASAASNVEQSGPATASDGVSANIVTNQQGASTTGFQFQAGKTNGACSIQTKNQFKFNPYKPRFFNKCDW